MNVFARILDALHKSRQREAEIVIRRYTPLVLQARAHEKRRELELAQARADDSTSRGMDFEPRTAS